MNLAVGLGKKLILLTGLGGSSDGLFVLLFPRWMGLFD